MTTNAPHPIRPAPGGAILLLSPSAAIAASVSAAFESDGRRLTVESGSLSAMNGRAHALVAAHDVVILDASRADGPEMELVSRLARGEAAPVMVALANEDLSISEARRLRDAGIGEVLPHGAPGDELRRTVDALLAGRAGVKEDGPDAPGRLIAVTQAAGGIGASTIAVNLARKLAGGGGFFRRKPTKRVALADLDLQFGSVATLLDLAAQGGLGQFVDVEPGACGALLRDALIGHSSGLRVLGAPSQMIPLHALTPEIVEAVVKGLRARHDHVVVDLPRVMVDWVEPVLRHADTVLVVTDTTVASVRQTRRLIDFFTELRPDLPVEVVVNRQSRPLLKPATVKETESVLERPLRHWLPAAPKETRRAADLGQPVVDLYPRARISRAFARLAATLDAPAGAAAKLST